jgi:hypothetical protein
MQTAYIKGRNIADNLQMLNSVIGMSDIEENINATAIALDAQKAFDSVNHEYIVTLLCKIGLHNFVPIFKLLYNNLANDILINGRISGRYNISNGVKQGDPLSCSLFLLSIEPVIRNLNANPLIRNIRSNRIQFSWPKVLAYADDITVVTENNDIAVNEIFREYQRLSAASGLYLNADKMEKFNIFSRNIQYPLLTNLVDYNGTTFTLNAQPKIKINGLYFDLNTEAMKEDNFNHMVEKMNNHFKNWSKRFLSLFGKVQIVKTFGISQYLYSLAVIDLSPEQ